MHVNHTSEWLLLKDRCKLFRFFSNFIEAIIHKGVNVSFEVAFCRIVLVLEWVTKVNIGLYYNKYFLINCFNVSTMCNLKMQYYMFLLLSESNAEFIQWKRMKIKIKHLGSRIFLTQYKWWGWCSQALIPELGNTSKGLSWEHQPCFS